MRLTLRTLLAYLDDILDPSRTKEIGEKISESDFAASLVDRIREVMRRRRLTAPDVTGPGAGIDANKVAEYLDNTLPPDQVADVEKVCLDSDIHLAEVAACHQILTLVLGEPVDVQQESRERMYALGPVSADESVIVPTEQPKVVSVVGTGERAVTSTVQETEAGPTDEGIPSYLQSTPFWRRALPYLTAVVVAAVWLALFVFDPTMQSEFFRTSTGDQNNLITENANQTGASSAENALGEVGTRIDTNVGEVTGNSEPNLEMNTVSAIGEPLSGEGINPAPPSDAEGSATPASTEAKTRPPLAPPLPTNQNPAPPANDTDSVPATVANENPPAETAAKPTVPMPTVQYVSNDEVFLHFNANDSSWMVLPARAMLQAGEMLVCPEPFQANLHVESGLLQASVVGGTSLRLLGPSAAGSFGFDLQEGKLILRRKLAAEDGAEVPPVRVAISALGRPWRMELLSAETVCGIEIQPRQPDQFEQEFEENLFSGRLTVVLGSVGFSDGNGLVRIIQEGEWISLSLPDLALLADAEQPMPNGSISIKPEWISLDPTSRSTVERQYTRIFEREFDRESPVRFSLLTATKSSRPKISELSVKCLALIENHEALARALNDPEHEEARLAAIEALRKWLPIKLENRLAVKESLAKAFHESDAEAVYYLLWGYNEADLHNGNVSKMLVDWLESDTIAIRELAFYHIKRLTDRTNDYRPNNPRSQRELAVKRWREHIENSALLKD